METPVTVMSRTGDVPEVIITPKVVRSTSVAVTLGFPPRRVVFFGHLPLSDDFNISRWRALLADDDHPRLLVDVPVSVDNLYLRLSHTSVGDVLFGRAFLANASFDRSLAGFGRGCVDSCHEREENRRQTDGDHSSYHGSAP